MHLGITGNIDFKEGVSSPSDLLFLGFHGYGNDESEMVRIINAICGDSNADNTTGSTVATFTHYPTTRRPSYLSFRTPHARPYIGHYWYPDGCSVSERRRACTEIGDSVVQLLDAPAFGQFRKVLIGFSQGGYLSYRMVAEHPDVFDAAILLSPSFKGEAASEPVAGHTRFALCHGTADRTIPAANQQCARAKLTATGNCTVFEYPGMAHAVCDQEIIDLRNWLKY